MSNNNTIAKFSGANTTIVNTNENDITLDGLVKTMENWRTHKQNRQEPIPEAIWDQIFILLDKFSETTLRSALNISGGQFRHKMQQRSEAHTSHEETPNSSVPFR